MSKTITRMNLAEAVYQEVGLSRNESGRLVDSIIEHMTNAIVSDELVKLSSFGTFTVRKKGARIGRNPKTGVEVPIEPRRVVTFRASQNMKQRVSQGNKVNSDGKIR